MNIKLTGYDSDAIGLFNIPKDFTRFLLCQICFSKNKDKPLILAHYLIVNSIVVFF